ncbi:MAG: GGDEF domain-containing protein [Solirubrobacterales bacterium]|nr:GGDEF domain-containing protein [Solirubrobacterales bacterium]
MTLLRTRTDLFRTAPPWQPRWLTAIFLAAAAMLAYTMVFPLVDDLDRTRRAVETMAALAAGAACRFLGPVIRIWMVHLLVVGGAVWTLTILARTDSPMVASLTLIVLLWFGVFIGACFRPAVTRVYAAGFCLGILVCMRIGAVPDGGAIGLAFAGSFVVIMEIMSRTTNQLRHEATTDPLTGLLNRTGLEREVRRVRNFRRDDRIAVLVADLDGLKLVNDRQGHKAGDKMLREFAKAWRADVRVGDLVARIGGDEFVVVFPEVGEEAARNLVDRLRRRSPTSWSGGLVIAGPDEPLGDCIARADRILYREKQAKADEASGGGRTGDESPSGLTLL